MVQGVEELVHSKNMTEIIYETRLNCESANGNDQKDRKDYPLRFVLNMKGASANSRDPGGGGGLDINRNCVDLIV